MHRVIALSLLLLAALSLSAFGQVTTQNMVKAIDKSKLKHPYLYFSDADKPAILERIKNDPESRNIMERLKKQADRLLDTTVNMEIPNEQKHPRYWSDGVHDRMVGGDRNAVETLAFVYQMTGDVKYAQKAYEFADALCDMRLWLYRAHEFPIIYSRVWPWGVKDDQVSFNFDIRSGDMSFELGTAYDWLYPGLTNAQRDRIRGALLSNAILLVRNNYDYHWWATAYRCNWCGICFSGFGIASLALLTENPELVDGVAETYNRLTKMFDCYDQDGGWQEGRGYWAYGMRSCIFYMDALNRLTDRKYDLFRHPKIKSNPATFALYGLTGYFGDGSGAVVGSPHLLNKLIEETKDTDAAYYRAYLLGTGSDMFDIIWPRSSVQPVEPRQKSKHFRGIDWAVMRSDFKDPEKVTVACKAGMNDDPHHGHLDAGQFMVNWRGQAYVSDLGSGKYFYDEKYFDEIRWKYPMAGSEGHNLIFVNGEYQLSAKYKDKPWTPGIGGKILEFRTSGARDYTLMDNTNAYAKEHLKGWRRHIILDKPMVTVLLDEVKSAPGAEIEARFHSDCTIAAQENFTLLKGSKGVMAIIPVADGKITMKPGSHSYTPVRKDAEMVVIPCAGAFTTARSENTRIATIILPIRDDTEAKEISQSAKSATDGAGNLILSFAKENRNYTYTFKNGKNGLVLE
ncbi:MAG: heparinase II/III family protein [Candidatus Latescibacter sp.]|nr:heparinase II/III family protein [Candidatus Latescibacter sp.]